MKIRNFLLFAILVGVFLLPIAVQAQAPTPTPSPVRSLSDNIAALSQRAGSLLPYFGNEIANGNETGQQSVLQRLYLAQRESFNDSYAKFQQNMFTVKVDGRETAINPVPLASESVLGIIVDSESTIQNFDQKADVSQWNLATMMTWLNFERALIEFGDLILVILGAALTLGLKLAMPFMLAGIVDKHIASKTTYPFFYGLIALTLVWPSVSKIIRIVAYMWGNVAMAVGDSSPLYIWNYDTMRAITDPLAQPQYTIALAAFGMGLGALCLYGTPFISLYFLSGRIYESVATVTSSWMGAMIGTGIEKYSAEAAASINRQAETTQYGAGYQADVTRSGGQLEAGNMRAQGQRAAQLASIQAALTSQVAATVGGATTQRMIIQAAAGFQKSQVNADVGRSIRETNISRDQQVGTTTAGVTKEKVMAAGESHAAKTDAWGRNLKEAVPPEIPILRPALGGGFENAAIGTRNRTVNQTADVFRESVTGLQKTAADKSVSSSQQYQSDMTVAINQQAREQTAGVNAGAGEAIGGYQRGAGQARRGVDENYRLELGANKEVYVTQVDAAKQIRDAGFQSASLRQAAAVVAAVGREISREVGQGMRIRF